MEDNQRNNPKSSGKGQGKNTDLKNQLKTIFLYLQENVATASMISEATGIPQKNICRFKRDLELSGRLWEIEKKLCKKTGFRAWYLTTDPLKAPFNNQLKLF
jgi:hypothetical protein